MSDRAANVFLFSGQGTQSFHMGAGLKGQHPPFEAALGRRAEAASDVLGTSLLSIVYDPNRRRSDPFADPRTSNVALLTVQCALAEALGEEGIAPDVACGMSLGETAAAVVAGVLPFEVALRVAAETGACFSDRCAPGAVVAVLAPVDIFYDSPLLQRSAEIIFEGAGAHFVIAGDRREMGDVLDHLRRHEVAFQSLPVAFGYHSTNVEPARGAFMRALGGVAFAAPRLPLYSCVRPGRVERVDAEHLWRAARGPMRFIEAIASLPKDRRYRFVDLGPAGTLANVVRRCDRTAAVFPIVTPFGDGHRNLERLLDSVAASGSTADGSMADGSAADGSAADGSTADGSTAAGPRGGSKCAWVFPGQGSQFRGMGGDLFARYPDLVAQADDILGYSVAALCTSDPRSELNRTQFTQPALFVVNALMFHERLDRAPPPDVVAGHSLGEYSALYAAGVLDFATGVRLVRKRGALMAAAHSGGMAAVIGLSADQVRAVLDGPGLEDVEIANLNSPSQVVVSGPRSAVFSAQPRFEAAGCARYVPLNVSAAFHSRLMAPAADAFAAFLADLRCGPCRAPVIANATAAPYGEGAGEVARQLVGQITRAVRWTDTVAYLRDQGVAEIVEVGPGEVLTKLIAACGPFPPPDPARTGARGAHGPDRPPARSPSP